MGHVEDFYFPSSNGNDKIRVRKWTLKEKPKAVLQIVHGIVEHIERYDDFANYVRDKGIVVVGDDHLGHGKSVANEEGYGFFAEENGWNFMVKDLHTLYKMTSSEYPDVPYFILGHSMGSFLKRT